MSRSPDPLADQELRRALMKLGLSESESRAYIALLAEGQLTAMDVSRRAGVPYSKVYDVLRRLEDRGWVVALEGSRPATFAARHPREAVEIWRSIREREMRRYEEEAVEKLERIARGGAQEKHDLWISRGIDAALSSVRRVLERCEEDALLAIPEELSGRVEELLAPLSGARGRVLVMAPSPEVAGKVKERLPGASVRVKGDMFGGGAICGTSSVVLLLGEKEKGEPYVAIASEHPGLALLARSYFGHLWSLAGEEGNVNP